MYRYSTEVYLQRPDFNAICKDCAQGHLKPNCGYEAQSRRSMHVSGIIWECNGYKQTTCGNCGNCETYLRCIRSSIVVKSDRIAENGLENCSWKPKP